MADVSSSPERKHQKGRENKEISLTPALTPALTLDYWIIKWVILLHWNNCPRFGWKQSIGVLLFVFHIRPPPTYMAGWLKRFPWITVVQNPNPNPPSDSIYIGECNSCIWLLCVDVLMCYNESSSDEDDFSIFVLGNVCRETISEIP